MSSNPVLPKLFGNVEIVRFLLALSIGAFFGTLLLLTTADRLIVINDEGIYLDGAVRVLRGEVPYRDFFAICGPGTFWMLAGIFRVAGISLSSARILLALDLTLLSGLTFWLTSQLASRTTAVCAALLFGALSLSGPNNIVVNHRWDSSALALAAICAALSAIRRPRRSTVMLASFFSILAAWVTPSMGLLAIGIGAWLYGSIRAGWAAASYLAGILAGVSIPAAVLMWQGALLPMVYNLLWTAANYSSANQMVYGGIFDNPTKVLAGATAAQWIVTVPLLLATFLPAILPPAMLLAWGPSLRRCRGLEALLLFCGAVLVATTYPRWDLQHLLYISPVFLVLAAWFMERVPPRGLALAAFAGVMIPASVMCAHNLWSDTDVKMQAPIGLIDVPAPDAPAVEMCLQRIQRGSTLFVFPYEPIFYFLSGARNPTRYDFLQPGMMTSADERAAVAELENRRPEVVLYRDVPAAAYLRIWPSSDPKRLRMNEIETFLRKYYKPDAAGIAGERQLLTRR